MLRASSWGKKWASKIHLSLWTITLPSIKNDTLIASPRMKLKACILRVCRPRGGSLSAVTRGGENKASAGSMTVAAKAVRSRMLTNAMLPEPHALFDNATVSCRLRWPFINRRPHFRSASQACLQLTPLKHLRQHSMPPFASKAPWRASTKTRNN